MQKPILLISECQSVTKIKVGHHLSSVTIVVALLKIGYEEKKERYVLLSPVSGVSLQITIQIVPSEWWIQQNKERERMHLPSSILIFHRLFHLFLIIPLTWLCHSHPKEINLVQQRQVLLQKGWCVIISICYVSSTPTGE